MILTKNLIFQQFFVFYLYDSYEVEAQNLYLKKNFGCSHNPARECLKWEKDVGAWNFCLNDK